MPAKKTSTDSSKRAATKKPSVEDKTALSVSKTGMVREIQVPALDSNDYARLTGFKSATDFNEQFVWELQMNETKYTITLYGKLLGKTERGTKNEYGFPPPKEEIALSGACLFVCQETDLTSKLWDDLFEMIYEKYEAEEEDGGDDEDDEVRDDDDEGDEEEGDDEEEDEVGEEEEEALLVKGRKKRGTKANKKGAAIDDGLLFVQEIVEQFLDCSCELEYEPFV